jgi:hypothetical protein
MLVVTELPKGPGLRADGHSRVQTASGRLGLAAFATILYAGLAIGIEDVEHKTILPIGSLSAAARAFEGDLYLTTIHPTARKALSAETEVPRTPYT